MRVDKINYTCDDCKNVHTTFKSRNAALAAGWAVARDYTKCYCPTCAPSHRLGGANGKHKRPQQLRLPKGYEQITLEEHLLKIKM